MATLKSTKINGALQISSNGTINIGNKKGTWVKGFGQSPIKLEAVSNTNTTVINSWINQENEASSLDYWSHFTLGTLNKDITLIGLNMDDGDNVEVDIDEVLTTDYISPDYMVRWWFNVESGKAGVVGSENRLETTTFYYLNSNNYKDYVPTKTGSGASGTWGINISGNAASLSSALSVNKGGTGNTSMNTSSTDYKGFYALADNKLGTNAFFSVSSTSFGIDRTDKTTARVGVSNYWNTVDICTATGAGLQCEAQLFTDGSRPGSVYGRANKWLIYIDPSGTVKSNASDRRKKIYLKDIPEDEACVLLNIPIRNFIYKEDINNNNLIQNGIFAQDLKELLKINNIGNRPYLQWEYNDDDRDGIYYNINAPEKDDMTYSVSYDHMVPALIKGWQMQNKEIEELEKKLAILRIKKINGLSS